MSSNNIKIEFELRPCMINMVSDSLWAGDKEIGIKLNERKALFHKWVEYENRISLIDQKCIYGLVEYENGEVALVEPEKIRFLDSIAQDKDDRKTTLLTLLEMHASGDFPKKIKIHNCVYTWDDEEVDYCCRPSEDSDLHNKLYDNYYIFTSLNMEIEILDDKEFDENNKTYDFEESN